MSNPNGDTYLKRMFCISFFIFSSIVIAILINFIFFKYRFMFDIPVYVVSCLISGLYLHFRAEMIYSSCFMIKNQSEAELLKLFYSKVLVYLIMLFAAFLNLRFLKYRFTHDYKIYMALFLIGFIHVLDNFIILYWDGRGFFGLYYAFFYFLIALPVILVESSYELIFHFKDTYNKEYITHFLIALILYIFSLKIAITIINLSSFSYRFNYDFVVYIILCLLFFVLSIINAIKIERL